jgi:hypothetical protein
LLDGRDGGVWVGQITPVVHYCMGGVKTNEHAQVCVCGGGGSLCVWGGNMPSICRMGGVVQITPAWGASRSTSIPGLEGVCGAPQWVGGGGWRG